MLILVLLSAHELSEISYNSSSVILILLQMSVLSFGLFARRRSSTIAVLLLLLRSHSFLLQASRLSLIVLLIDQSVRHSLPRRWNNKEGLVIIIVILLLLVSASATTLTAAAAAFIEDLIPFVGVGWFAGRTGLTMTAAAAASAVS